MLSMIRIRHELSILPIGIYTIKVILDPLECLCDRLIAPATNRPHSAIAVSPVR
jgi:hypothetical protein